MATTIRVSGANDELGTLLRTVRGRWRLRVLLIGLAAVLGVALVALLAAAWMIARGGDELVVAVRVGLGVLVLAATAWFVARPLRRAPPDRQVALYLEEHEPTLDAAVVSAVEWRERDVAGPFGEQLTATAVERARAVEFGKRVEREPLRRAMLMLGAVIGAAVVTLALAPSAVQEGLRRLFLPAAEAMPVGMRRIAVEPGDTEVARGGDQLVRATLAGFTSDSVELYMRALPDSVSDSAAVAADGGAWMRIPMTRDSAGAFAVRIFDVVTATEYFVESEDVRSATHRLTVVDLPAVDRLDLVYDFPAYTGLAPDSVTDGGDIAAPVGTRVRVRTFTTMPVTGGRLVVEGGDTVSLAATPDGALEGTLSVRRAGFYHVELDAAGGRTVRGSLDYVIDVVEDRPPTVSISKPGRDVQPTSLEEVFAEARADDDYGVARLELVYQVNGGPEQVVRLHGGRAMREVTAGHTFFLEEFMLEPGDVVSYHARATDANAATGPQTATTDIYFMQIRRFGRDYRSAEQQGGGGGQQSSPGSLSRRQRDLVAATFRARGEMKTDPARARQDVSTIMIGQGRLREEAEELSNQLVMRGVAMSDTNFAKVARELPLAVRAMREAEEALARRDVEAALGPEQRALQHLQRAEAAFRETEVARNSGGGGGGGGGESSAEELADLFELEADKLQNQYEAVDRAGTPEQRQQEVDEIAERLRELARRQQREDERMREAAERMRQQAGGGGGASDGGAAQRRLAAEADSLARQLERLVRQQPSQSLRDAARGLQEAADQMRRAAAGGRSGAQGSSSAEARERLDEARRRLEQARQAGLEDAVQDARRRAGELASRQRELQGDAARAGRETGAQRQQSLQRLAQDRQALAQDADALESQLGRAAREARSEQPAAARRLQEAATEMRDRRLADKLRFSAEVTGRASPEMERNLEAQIAEDVDAVREALEAAAGAIREPASRRGNEALDRARSLARATESMRERTRAAGEGGEGEQAQEGRQGEGAAPGEGGRQGRGGQASEGQQQGVGGARGGEQGGQPSGGLAGEGGGTDSRGGLRASGGGLGRMDGSRVGGSGQISDARARQLAREAGERRREAEALRRAVDAQGLGTRDLDRLLADLRALERERTYDDAEEVARLQASVVEGFKAFEFALRRAMGDAPDRPLVGRAIEAPPEYRALVEEYYRSLARTPPR